MAAILLFTAFSITQLYLAVQLNLYLHNSPLANGREYPTAIDFLIVVLFSICWYIHEKVSDYLFRGTFEKWVKGGDDKELKKFYTTKALHFYFKS